MRLILAHPEVAGRACSDCRSWLYEPNGRRSVRSGRPVVRPRGTPTPCKTCPKIPDGMPADPLYAVELTAELIQTYEHYLRCKAVGWQVPEARDPVVQRNAAVIKAVEDAVEREQNRRVGLSVIGSLLQGSG